MVEEMAELIDAREVVNDGKKRSSPFREPVPSEAIISPFVMSAMERYIVPLLGRGFYDVLVEEKGEVISVYNPSERREEEVILAFGDNEEYEDLWIKGGLRVLCGWSVALEALISLGTQLGQGGVVKASSDGIKRGGDNDDEDRLRNNWEVSVEVLGKRVKDYLSKKVDVVGFETYKQYVESDVYNSEDDSMFREVGILKTKIPSW